ncbi:MAG: hypothetical protein K0R43_3962 [Pseudoduganella sp.]|jgi:hypothetical protein|nr:hypothetical protein [Pseudoduganella sp.]
MESQADHGVLAQHDGLMDASNDLFAFGEVDSYDGADGSAASGNWTDVIEVAFDEGAAGGDSGAWTEAIEGQQIVDGHGAGQGGGADHAGDMGHAPMHGQDNFDKLDW